MTHKELSERRQEVSRLLADHRLADALAALQNLALATSAAGDLRDEIDRQQTTYRAMLQYLTVGGDDPQRDAVLGRLRTAAYQLLDQLTRAELAKDASTLYYNEVRTQKLRGPSVDSIAGLLDKYMPLGAHLYDSEAPVDDMHRRRAEELEKELFNALWISVALVPDDYNRLQDFFADPEQNWQAKALLISALTLSLFEFYDAQKILLLIALYQTEDARLAMRALVGLIFALYRYRNRTADAQIENALAGIGDNVKHWAADVEMAYLALIRTRDTERVSRKMQTEVFPGLQNLGKDIQKEFGKNKDIEKIIDPDSEVEGFEGMEINPEWEEKLRQSGLHDRLMEMSELQYEGSDVMMASFAHMKSFPFFNDVNNWFLPFVSQRSVLGNSANDAFLTTLTSMPMLCESDKYSIALSMSQHMQQLEAMKGMMGAQGFAEKGSAMMEAMGLTPNDPNSPAMRKYWLNTYLHDLYRFFKLFHRKNEFRDPFVKAIDLTSAPQLMPLLKNIDTQRLVAELYFKFEDYEHALRAYEALSEMGELSEELEQKIGWCYQKQGQYAQALVHYEQAELFNSQSTWTLKRMAACYRQLGQHEKAVECLKKFESLKSDTVANAMALGLELLAIGRYHEALQHFFKVEFLKPENTKYLRPLAWCLLNDNQRQRSRQYFDRILQDAPTANDYLNMGHLELLEGDMAQAVNYYRASVEHSDGETFRQALLKDGDTLKALGLDTSKMPLTLLIDAVLMN